MSDEPKYTEGTGSYNIMREGREDVLLMHWVNYGEALVLLKDYRERGAAAPKPQGHVFFIIYRLAHPDV